MAEYLHLYRDDESGTTELDYDLRGSVYWLESDGWTPATMPDVPYEERATATEVLSLGVFASTAAGVADAIADLRRLLGEARRRANLERYPSTLTYLRHYPDGGSEDDYRTAEVVGGQVRWSKVLGRRIEQSDGSEYVAEVVVEIEHRAPLGEPETLKNLCPNPSFEWDTNSDGLANNWGEFGTTTSQTPAIVAVDNRYGAYGQELTLTDAIAAGTGVNNSANITVVAETEYHLKAWVDNSGNTNAFYVSVRDITGGALIATSVLTFAAGAAGAQQSVSFSTPASCVAVRVMAYWANGAATVGDVAVVDGVYLGLKGARAPQAWASYCSIQNHCDGAAVSTDHNWVDVADVPGECEAVLETTVSDEAEMLILTRKTAEACWLPNLWLQAESAGTDGPGWSLDTDAGASGAATNNVRDLTRVVGSEYSALYWTISAVATIRQLWGSYRPFLLVKRMGASDIMLDVWYYVGSVDGAAGVLVGSETKLLNSSAGSWEAVRGPVISIPVNLPSAEYPEQVCIYIAVYTSVYEEVRIDALVLEPVDEGYSQMYDHTPGHSAGYGDSLIVSGFEGQLHQYDNSAGIYLGPVADEGLLDHLVPMIPQRLLFLYLNKQTVLTRTVEFFDKTITPEVELTYRPRWLSL